MPEHTISEAQARAILALAPWAVGGPHSLETALQTLLEAERLRRGEPDPGTGAIHQFALTQGTLLRDEYDLSTHGHWPAWEIGVLTVDVREMIRINQELGFELGDAVLRRVVEVLRTLHPRSPVVRIHSDAFAVLFPPSANETVSLEMKARADTRLREEVETLLRERTGGGALPVAFTIAALRLEIAQPSHWQVLGPLVWAEAERAHVIERRGQSGGVQHRRISLGGAVEEREGG